MGRFPSRKSPGKQAIKKRGIKRFLICSRWATEGKTTASIWIKLKIMMWPNLQYKRRAMSGYMQPRSRRTLISDKALPLVRETRPSPEQAESHE